MSGITRIDMRALVGAVRRKPGRLGKSLTTETVADVFRYLRGIYLWARREDVYTGPGPTNMSNARPQPSKDRKVFLTEDEARRLFR